MKFYKNIIIGAGPAGIQCGYFFQKHNIEYLIIERNNKCGSFFESFPHGNTLISINKKYTGNDNDDFNLRHDWNSLLNDDKLLFGSYSDNFYPHKDQLVQYLNDYANHYNLNILYNTNVIKIIKINNEYYIKYKKNEDDDISNKSDDSLTYSVDENNENILNNEFINNYNNVFMCHNLIIATGLSLPNIPEMVMNIHTPIPHYYNYKNNEINLSQNEEYKNKKILIIGGGNSSYELGNMLNEVASSIFILGRSNREWSISSHYAGDIRSIYTTFMDTFLLKSLNAIDQVYNNQLYITLGIEQTEVNGEYRIYFMNKVTKEKYDLIPNGRNNYDKVILCTGWKFDKSIFDFDLNMTLNNKYPEIKSNYESTNNNNLYFIGSLMHSLDYRISSGGFIHGFRYLIKTFMNMNYNIPFDNLLFDLNFENELSNLIDLIIFRLNTSSDLYQMFGFISDIFYYDRYCNKMYYYMNVPTNINFGNTVHNFMTRNKEIENNNIYFVLTLEYGDKVYNINEIGKKFSNIGSESKSKLIHPIIKVYNPNLEINNIMDIQHFDEDLFAEFYDKEKYVYKLFRYIRSFI
jgi:hypothetical protein